MLSEHFTTCHDISWPLHTLHANPFCSWGIYGHLTSLGFALSLNVSLSYVAAMHEQGKGAATRRRFAATFHLTKQREATAQVQNRRTQKETCLLLVFRLSSLFHPGFILFPSPGGKTFGNVRTRSADVALVHARMTVD